MPLSPDLSALLHSCRSSCVWRETVRCRSCDTERFSRRERKQAGIFLCFATPLKFRVWPGARRLPVGCSKAGSRIPP